MELNRKHIEEILKKKEAELNLSLRVKNKFLETVEKNFKSEINGLKEELEKTKNDAEDSFTNSTMRLSELRKSHRNEIIVLEATHEFEVAEKVKETVDSTFAFMIEGMNKPWDATILSFQLARGPFDVTNVDFNAHCEVTPYFDVRNLSLPLWQNFATKYKDIVILSCPKLRALPFQYGCSGCGGATNDISVLGSGNKDV
ncbi:hypothetical protein V6N13_110536 [Hibiscus sabdariffa]|uniref:Uncharacterized protein n=1 Tax=Hibiscus sabdariffa TaxID=183260 RepID=A0ABR2THI8_9ROSI